MKAEIFNHQCWINETSADKLIDTMDQYLSIAGFNVLQKVHQIFENEGFTAIWILAESHLAIHTFPEAGKTYVEISSCNARKNQLFINQLQCLIPEIIE
jgi:S-adenosylmethionine/arginine decarboxylase-like enzyme